ncbi:MAG: cobyrinate a,c-diamide synthase [Nitrospirae bacterium]|nr:cobyrinate a,c-diamide synthase [Nitrospirota bacterium]
MAKSIPRIIISGLKGGSGKTVISLSLCSAWNAEKKKVAVFKKGPDYIDAGWLAQASGSPCHNLDLFMMNSSQIKSSFLLRASNSDIAVIEGNRGLYDGLDDKGSCSTAELAKLLDTPVILIADCTKSTNTVAATILGCQTMDPDVPIKGVVLNNVVTKRQELLIRRSVERHCGVPVVGAIPRLKENPFPERHMGLTPFQEHEDTAGGIRAVEKLCADYLDIDTIWKIASEAEALNAYSAFRVQHSARDNREKVKIGVIKDSAFQFYYPENIEELIKRGARIVELNIFKDSKLPDLHALYIGGGFPETNAVTLAENTGFKDSLKEAIENGLPVYAECGGLMYLGERLIINGKTYPMTGIFPLTFSLGIKPSAHGYTVIEVIKDNPFFKKGCVLKGHEFHYSTVSDAADQKIEMCFSMSRGKGIREKMDGLFYKNVLATYTHLHAIGSPEWADGIINCAITYRNQRQKTKNKT